LPSSEVNDPRVYFIENALKPLREILMELNELFNFSIAEAEKLVTKMWVTRYHSFFRPKDFELNMDLIIAEAMCSVVLNRDNFTPKTVSAIKATFLDF
jgi:hypothetical protein